MVRLITSLGFNDLAADLPSMGGDNLEVVGNLRKEIRASLPGKQHLFQLRWYSKDGIDPIVGNGKWASHTKYMSVDDRVAVVGSGNMDTPSWNLSHEFNVLIDDAPTVARLEKSLFLPDWARAVGSYVELYEGNGVTQRSEATETRTGSEAAAHDRPAKRVTEGRSPYARGRLRRPAVARYPPFLRFSVRSR